MGEWIKTAERLPEPDDLVLAVVWGKPAKNVELKGSYQLASHSPEGWLVEEWPRWEGAVVTHWMPLSEPPEGV